MLTEKETKDLLEVLKTNGVNLLETKGGKTVEEALEEKDQEIAKLKQEILDQKSLITLIRETVEEMFGKSNFDSNNHYTGSGTSSGGGGVNPNAPNNSSPTNPSNNLPTDPWDAFFSGKNDITDKDAWKSSLSIGDAELVYNNGWRNLTNEYSSDGQTTKNVDQKIHQRGEIDKVHNLLNKIKNETNSSSLPSDSDIGNDYNQDKVPAGINYVEVTKKRDEKIKQLFREAFEGTTPSGLDAVKDAAKIDLWRTKVTGLRQTTTAIVNDPKLARQAFNNGWIDPTQITDGKLTSGTDVVEVLKHNKKQLDNANAIIAEGKTKTSFIPFDQWQTSKTKEINALVDDQLPASEYKEQIKLDGTKEQVLVKRGKQQKDVLELLQEHRNTFTYKINVEDNENKGDGLNPQDLTSAQEQLKEENQWKSKEFKLLTADILNELLADFLDKNAQKEDLDSWLRGLGGYTIDKEPTRKIKVAEVKEVNGREEFTGQRLEIDVDGQKVLTEEEKWTKDKRLDLTGTYLLPFVYSLINFDPDAVGDDIYAKLDGNGEIDKSGNGVLAILTGGGKTTKTVGCLVHGKKNNIVLICPNEALAADAEIHHKTWLQKNDKTNEPYKCVVHGEYHGGYDVVRNDLIYYEDRTDPQNVQKKGEYGLSILQAEKLLGYVARSAVKPEKLQEPKGKVAQGLIDKGQQLNENFDQNVAEMKKKVISKEDTIIVFDEAHFNDPKYQELQKTLVKMKYKVIIMSATFPKKKFSITMSQPRGVWRVPQFEPEYLKDEQGNILTTKDASGQVVQVEKWMKQKTQIFLRTTEDEFEINPTTGKKGKQLLWSGLTAKQKKFLDDNNISYVCFDRTNQGAVTGITQGMPDGSLFFANPDHEMGFSPYVHNVICAGQSQLISLGKSGTPWVYDTPEIISLFLASMVQQIGRVARLFPGTAYLVAKELYDIDAATGQAKVLNSPKDLSYKFLNAALTGEKASLDALKKQGANMGDDPNFLRAALALPYKFGYKPEEILVGTGGIKPLYPIFGIKPTPPVVDEELWNRHLGNPTPPKIDKERSEQIILIIAMTFLKNQSSISNQIDISFSNPLIKSIWGKEVPKKGSKKGETELVLEEGERKKAAEELRKVLHTVIDKYRRELKGYGDGKVEYLATEKGTFSTLVNLYRVVNRTEIEVETIIDKGKEETYIKMTYPPKIGQRILGEWEEIDVWKCHRCLKINNGYRFCQECGIDVRIDQKEKIRILEQYQEVLEAQILQSETKI